MSDPETRLSKAGLPPGTTVYTGVSGPGPVKIYAIDYDREHFVQREVEDPAECAEFLETLTPTWIRVDGVHQVELVQAVGEVFGLHPLVIEDICSVGQRPKVDDYDSHLYVVFRLCELDPSTGRVAFEQVSVLLGETWVLSFQEGPESIFEMLRESLEGGRGRIRSMGPDYLAYRLLDAVVDQYFLILEQLGDQVESLEESLVEQPNHQQLARLQDLKRDLMSTRRALWPLREAVSVLDRADSELLRRETKPYFKDLYDHCVHALEMIENELELVSAMHDLYMNAVSNRLNEIMKLLTVISVVFLPMNFLAGLYGMNFERMPELKWPLGYPFALSLMFLTALSMLHYFRSREWV